MTNTQIIDYNITDAAIAEMKAKFSGMTANDNDEYKAVSNAIAIIRDYRVSVEKKRKELKADSLEWGRKIDTEAKRVTVMLEEIEDPLKAVKKAIDDEKERLKLEKENAEKMRVQNILNKIQEIRDFKNKYSIQVNTCEEILQGNVEFLTSDGLKGFDFQEFLDDALRAITEVNNYFEDIYSKRKAFEDEQAKLVVERAAIEKEREEHRLTKDAETKRIEEEIAEQNKKLTEEKKKLNQQQQAMEEKERQLEAERRILADRELEIESKKAIQNLLDSFSEENLSSNTIIVDTTPIIQSTKNILYIINAINILLNEIERRIIERDENSTDHLEFVREQLKIIIN